MKTKKHWYAFSEKELEILKEVAFGSQELAQIEHNLSIKPNLLSYHLKKLQEKEILQTKSLNYVSLKARKMVLFTHRKHALLLRKLICDQSFPVRWEKVLSDFGVEVLFSLISYPTHIKAVSKSTFWRYFKKLSNLDIVTLSDAGFYQVNCFFSALIDFITEYQLYVAEKLLRNISIEARILWQKGSEILIKVPKGTEITQQGFSKTATSVLSRYRIATLVDFDVYFYSKLLNEVSIEETILHILLIERGNPRYSTYSYLLFNKQLGNIDEELLLRKAEWYDLSFQINHMLKIVRVNRKPLEL